jgi:hypothetical protein
VAHLTDVVEIPPLEERIRLLCAKAVTAEESEIPEIFAELQAALHEHSQLVREMARATLRWTSSSNSNAAD